MNVITDNTGSFPATGTTIHSVNTTNSLLDTSLAVDSQSPNIVHAITTYLSSGHWTLRYRNNQGGWGAGTDEVPNNLPSDASCDEYLYAAIAVDSNHNPHIAYLCRETANDVCTIYYATKSGSDWTHTSIGNVMVSNCSGTLSARHRPSLALDTSGKAHIAWFDDDTNAIMYRTNSSGSWSAAAAADSSNTAYGDCAITLDAGKKPYIFFRDGSQNLKLTTSNSGSWITESTGATHVTGVGTAATTGVAGRSNH